MQYIDIFVSNILPIFLIAGAGFLIGKFTEVDPRTISRVVFYLFTPSLIFDSLTKSPLNQNDTILIAAYTIANLIAMGIITWILAKSFKLDRKMIIALLLTTLFTNSGNFGLSLNLFAFGDDALSYATLFFSTNAVLMYSVGVILASMGAVSLRKALFSILKVPVIYALAFALLFNLTNWELPLFLDRPISLLAQASIPSMLVLLGLQLQKADLSNHKRELSLANVLRLAIAPLVAIGLSALFGFSGILRKAGITELAMPTAVTAIVIATEYNVEPAFVTTVVTTTTLLSPLMLTPLLLYLNR
ncbi:MAG: AEC family transporter [Anaerolineales bacterium]|nr:AEC family transporter [Anaerolineales bacterium]